MEISPGVIVGFKIPGSFEGEAGFRRRKQVGGSAHQPGNVLREHVERLARRIPSRKSLCVCWKSGQVFVPPIRKAAMLHTVEVVREFGILFPVPIKLSDPLLAQFVATFADALAEMFPYTVRDKKLSIFRPAVVAFGEADFIFAQRLAMSRARILLVRGSISDVRVNDNQSRAVVSLQEATICSREHLEIVR